MVKTMPGIDRITRQRLVTLKVDAKRLVESHDKGCLMCQRSAGDLYARCSAWWTLAKALHVATRHLIAYDCLHSDQGQQELDLGM